MSYIYHYTSVESLLGMLHTPTEHELNEVSDNGNDPDYGYYLEFHASDLRLMNDKQENKLIIDVDKHVPHELSLARSLADWVYNKPYIVSFCRRQDFIPMWKIYATKGNGICLKFKRDSLSLEDAIKKINKSKFHDIILKDCIYLTESEFRKYIKSVVKQIKEFANELVQGQSILPGQRDLHDFNAESAFLKLRSFDYEQETRLAVFADLNYYTKQGKHGIALYHPVKIPLRFLEEIIIGPSVNQDILEYSVYELLKNKRYDKLKTYDIDIKVKKTSIELR